MLNDLQNLVVPTLIAVGMIVIIVDSLVYWPKEIKRQQELKD